MSSNPNMISTPNMNSNPNTHTVSDNGDIGMMTDQEAISEFRRWVRSPGAPQPAIEAQKNFDKDGSLPRYTRQVRFFLKERAVMSAMDPSSMRHLSHASGADTSGMIRSRDGGGENVAFPGEQGKRALDPFGNSPPAWGNSEHLGGFAGELRRRSDGRGSATPHDDASMQDSRRSQERAIGGNVGMGIMGVAVDGMVDMMRGGGIGGDGGGGVKEPSRNQVSPLSFRSPSP